MPRYDRFSIQIQHGNTGLWYANSAEIMGLFVAERTLPELFREISLAMDALEKARAELSLCEAESEDGEK